MTGIIIQARTTSTRLPGKVMKKLAGKEVLWHMVERCKASKRADKIIVATSTDPRDDIIYEYCRKNTIDVFRGNLSNVLERYYRCAREYNLDVIIRVTSDCPLIDPYIIDESINLFFRSNVDYVSNCLERIFPRGLDCEVFSFSSLKNAFKKAESEEEKEHVTPYIIKHNSVMAYRVEDRYKGNFRITLDEEDDYKLLRILYDTFYKNGEIIDAAKIIKFLKDNPDIARINNNVKQKI